MKVGYNRNLMALWCFMACSCSC